MNRQQLAHALRAAASLLGDRQFVVIGSAAILGSFTDGLMTDDLTLSTEVDLLPPDDDTESKSLAIDGAQGELSDFHRTHGFYVDGASTTTARVPTGWQERVIPFAPNDADGAVGWCLSPADLVATKAVAGRQKDFRFASAALDQHLVDPDEVLALIPTIHDEPERLEAALRFIKSRRTRQPGTMRPQLDTSGVKKIPVFEPESFGIPVITEEPPRT